MSRKPISMVREMRPGQPTISASGQNSVLHTVKSLVRTLGRGIAGRRSMASDDGVIGLDVLTERHICVIRDKGPAANPDDYPGVPPSQVPEFEPDLTDDAMYWVSKAYKLTEGSTRKNPLGWAEYPDDHALYMVVPAMNIAELGGGGRGVSPGDVVIVTGSYQPTDAGPIKVYTFERAPGSPKILCIAVSCSRDEITGSTMVTCSRLLGFPYNYELDPENDADQFTAWAGVDPPIRPGVLVGVTRCAQIPGEPSIKYFAEFIMSVNPVSLDVPHYDCLTSFNEGCAPPTEIDLCDIVIAEGEI